MDLKKALDYVHRGKMFNILQARKIASAIEVLCKGITAYVISPDGKKIVDKKAAVLKGDPFSSI